MIISGYEAVARILISTAIGTMMGLEKKRDSKTKGRDIDIKMFSFSALFGSLSALAILFDIPFGEFFPLVGFISMLAITYSFLKPEIGKKYIKGIDQISFYTIPILFLLGLMIGSGFVWEGTAIAFIMVIILAIGKKLETTFELLTDEEISEIIQIGILLFVLFPILPQKPIEIYGIQLDLFLVFAFLLLVTVLNLFVFLAYRVFRNETSIVTGFIGGIINSTYSIYQLNKSNKGLTTSGVIAAMLGSILRNAVLVVIVMNELIMKIIPLFAIIALMFIFLILKERAKSANKIEKKLTKSNHLYKLEKPVTVINSAYATGFLILALIAFQISAKNFQQFLPIVSFVASMVSSGYTILSLSSVYMTISANELILSIATAIIGSFATSVTTTYLLNKEVGKGSLRYALIASILLLLYVLAIGII